MSPPTLILPADNPLTAQLDPMGIWSLTIFFGSVAIFLSIIKRTIKEIDIEFLLFWLYLVVHCLYFLQFPAQHFGLYTTAYQASAGQVLALALILPIGLWGFTPFGNVKLWYRLAKILVIYTLICVWLGWEGLFIGPSLGLAFCASTMTLLPWWIEIALLITICTHHATTAALIFGVQAFVMYLKEMPRITLLFLAFLVAGVYFNTGDEIWGGNGRLGQAQAMLPVWLSNWEYVLFGIGPGTYTWTNLTIHKFKGDVFLQAHSDWLQIVWELGLVGLGLAIACFIRAARNVWHKPPLLAALLGMATFMVTYHPFRMFGSMVLGVLILLSCRKEYAQKYD